MIRTPVKQLLSALSIQAALLITTAALLPREAAAKLGGDLASIQADATEISGTLEPAREKNGYTVYVIRSTDHHIRTLVEFLSADGTVVAIAASSRGNINTKRFIVSALFEKTRQARLAAPVAKIKGRVGPTRIEQGDVVMETSGHTGNLVFRAFLSSKLPPSLSEEMISPRAER